MAYVFQCDRCGNVGEEHTTTVAFTAVDQREVPSVVRSELCEDCDKYLKHVMTNNDQDYLSCSEKALLLSRLQAEAKHLGDEGMKPSDIIEKLLDMCEDAMTRQV